MKRFGLSARERIKSRKDFERIFEEHEILYSSENILRANYTLKHVSANNINRVLFAVAVSKKLGNAVWRNRVKRLIREAYRLNKVDLIEECKKKNATVEVIFSPQNLNQIKNKHLGLKNVMVPIKELIDKLKEKI